MSTLLYATDLNLAGDPGVRSSVSDAPNPDDVAVASSGDLIPNRPEPYATLTGGLQAHARASYVEPSAPVEPTGVTVGEPGITGLRDNDARQSIVGVAAAKEAQGEWGRGTLMVTEGIEPAWQDAPFSDVYFDAGTRAIQGGTRADVGGPKLSSTPQDAAKLAASREAAREARRVAYDAWLLS